MKLGTSYMNKNDPFLRDSEERNGKTPATTMEGRKAPSI